MKKFECKCGHKSTSCNYKASVTEYGKAVMDKDIGPMFNHSDSSEIDEATYFCEECGKPLTDY